MVLLFAGLGFKALARFVTICPGPSLGWPAGFTLLLFTLQERVHRSPLNHRWDVQVITFNVQLQAVVLHGRNVIKLSVKLVFCTCLSGASTNVFFVVSFSINRVEVGL